MLNKLTWFLSALWASGLTLSATDAQGAPASTPACVVTSEFIFDEAPFPSCHASTLAQTADGSLVAAWFGGSYERAPDVGIYVSRDDPGHWSEPREVATGSDDAGHPLPTWNPVLFQPNKGPLLLFYKVGPSPAAWWGMMMTSDDAGKTWSPPRRLPAGMLGPIKDKPIQLADGALLCPSSDESDGWKLHIEHTTNLGLTWTKTAPLNDGHKVRLIQPTLLDYGDGKMQLLCRSDSKHIYQSWSSDAGKTWETPVPTELLNPNSGIDAVRLSDGRSMLIYNPSATDRHPLAYAMSTDGLHWGAPRVLEDTTGPELSYPAVIQTSDGKVHITYTWERKRIRHLIVDPSKIPSQKSEER